LGISFGTILDLLIARSTSSWLSRAVPRAQRAAPFLAAILIATTASAEHGIENGAVDWDDLAAITHELRDVRHWDWAQTYRGLKANDDGLALAWLRLTPGGWLAEAP